MVAQMLYLSVSLLAVGALVGFCMLLFGRGVAALDKGRAQMRLVQDVPGFSFGAFALSVDGRHALAQDARDDAVYLVGVRGSDLVTRRLTRDFVKDIHRNGATMNFRFSDFTYPNAVIAFDGETTAQDWERRFA